MEQSLKQLEEYQRQIQELRKRIIQEEQQLRLILAPTYLPNDRDKAVSEQQVRFHYFSHFSFALSLSYVVILAQKVEFSSLF